MTRAFSEIEKKFSDLEMRFAELEGLNHFLAKQAKEYFLLFDATRKLNSANGLKPFFASLDKVLQKNFAIDEYTLITQNLSSDILSIRHSMGLPKRHLKEIFYRPGEGLVGKVFANKRAIYIPDCKTLKNFSYYFQNKALQGSLYYLPILDEHKNAIGVVKMRKYNREGFSDIERSVFPSLQAEICSCLENASKIDLLTSKSYVDELTSLYNRHFYQEHFTIEFKRAQRYQHDFSLIFIDVDDFKKVNDVYGHSIGDETLRRIGQLLQKYTRTSDMCIRFGGDEFLIMLPETSKPAAHEVASKLQKVVQEMPVHTNGRIPPLGVTVSIGVSSYPQDTIEPQLLFELVDRSLHTAKQNGKNKIILTENISVDS